MIIIHNYIQSKQLLKEFSNINWEYYRADQYDYGTVELLYEYKNTPQNPFEKFLEIFLDDIRFNKQIHPHKKVEYWINCLSKDTPLDWHRDMDQILEHTTSKVIHPKLGGVWYGFLKNLKGGNLEIKHEQNIKQVKPLQNRLVIFDVSKEHRVSTIFSGHRNALSFSVY